MSLHAPRTWSRLWKAAGLAVSSRQYFGYACRVLGSCLTRSGRASFGKNLRSLTLPPPGHADYPQWIRQRVARRGLELPRFSPDAARGTFSLLTTVYDTAPRYLHALHASLRAQTIADFEWIVLDNGSRDAGTRAALEVVREDPRVVFERVEENLGIIGGMRRCLAAAQRAWILPLDSDDVLYPDALALLLAATLREPQTELWYTDEDKIREDEAAPFEPFHKGDWDPVLFANSCYTSHLCCIRRERALELGVYGDRRAEGCHDWDTFFRFWHAGHRPGHLPEVTYSWRMHAGSCAGNMFSKDYIVESHRHVLQAHLDATVASPEHFEVARSPMFPGIFDWWLRRRPVAPWPVETISYAGLRAEAQIARTSPSLLALQSDRVTIVADDPWRFEAQGLFERFPDAALLGGRIFAADGTVFSAGEVLGFGDRITGAPDHGRHPDDPGHASTVRRQRSVRALSHHFFVVRADRLAELTAQLEVESPAAIAIWLAARAHELGWRVLYTPFVQGTLRDETGDEDRSLLGSSPEAAILRRRFPRFFERDPYYSMHLDRTVPFGLAPLPLDRPSD